MIEAGLSAAKEVFAAAKSEIAARMDVAVFALKVVGAVAVAVAAVAGKLVDFETAVVELLKLFVAEVVFLASASENYHTNLRPHLAQSW